MSNEQRQVASSLSSARNFLSTHLPQMGKDTAIPIILTTTALTGLACNILNTTTVPAAEPIPTTADVPTDPGPNIVITPATSTLIVPSSVPDTAIPPIELSPTTLPLKILTTSPPQWNTGEDEAAIKQRMSDIIVGQISGRPQYEAASEVLPQNYLGAVVNIEYEMDPSHPWGGTATLIGLNPQTNESIFITASHVILNENTTFHIKQPHSNIDIATSLDNIVVARSPAGLFNDLAIVKLPFIPEGMQPFPVTGTNLCVTEQPAENAVVRSYSFPYINYSDGGTGFTEFLSQGGIELLGDASTDTTATCWYEEGSGSLFIPTTMPTRPGTSGALVLDQNNQGIAIMKAISPHGAALMPIDTSLLTALIAQTGFVFQP